MQVTDLHVFSNTNYYSTLIKVDRLIFEQYKHFKKGSYSNRFYIAGANGKQILTIPIIHLGGEKQPLKDVKIAYYEPWRRIHWKSIVSAYNRSPWFDFYRDDLRRLYNKKPQFLLDWNLETFLTVGKWLGKTWEIRWTSSYVKALDSKEFLDMRDLFLPQQSEKSALYYPQVFEEKNGFLPNLSIIDLIFCEGSNALTLLKEYAAEREA